MPGPGCSPLVIPAARSCARGRLRQAKGCLALLAIILLLVHCVLADPDPDRKREVIRITPPSTSTGCVPGHGAGAAGQGAGRRGRRRARVAHVRH
eukprot:13465548-Heterocapsa_arctica.AAC.1